MRSHERGFVRRLQVQLFSDQPPSGGAGAASGVGRSIVALAGFDLGLGPRCRIRRLTLGTGLGRVLGRGRRHSLRGLAVLGFGLLGRLAPRAARLARRFFRRLGCGSRCGRSGEPGRKRSGSSITIRKPTRWGSSNSYSSPRRKKFRRIKQSRRLRRSRMLRRNRRHLQQNRRRDRLFERHRKNY